MLWVAVISGRKIKRDGGMLTETWKKWCERAGATPGSRSLSGTTHFGPSVVVRLDNAIAVTLVSTMMLMGKASVPDCRLRPGLESWLTMFFINRAVEPNYAVEHWCPDARIVFASQVVSFKAYIKEYMWDVICSTSSVVSARVAKHFLNKVLLSLFMWITFVPRTQSRHQVKTRQVDLTQLVSS